MKHEKEWCRYTELIAQRPELFQNNGPLKIVTDWEIVEKYQIQTGEIIGVRYESPYNILVVDLVYEKEGMYFTYERLLPAVAHGAVVCIPEFHGEYILLKQYRHSMRDYQYAIPRGYATDGLAGGENAKKELEEELGATIENVEYLGDVIADSGIAGNKVGIYLCHITKFQPNQGHEGIVDSLCVTKDDLANMIRSNKLSDGFSLSAYSHLILMEK